MRYVLLLLVAACSIPNTQFQASPDSPPGGDGDMGAGVQIFSSATQLSINEGSTGTFAVSLTKMPEQAVTVNVTPHDSGDGMAIIAVTESTLSFEPQNYNQPQTVHVQALADQDAIDEAEDVKLTADSLTDVTVVVTNVDVDHVEIATDISGTSISVNENGDVPVAVHLTHQPAGDVTITASAASSPSVSITGGTLVFHTTDWMTPQPFTINGIDDANAMPEQVALTLHASDANIQDAQYTINTIDDDALNIRATPLSLTIPEGSSRELDVSLTADPGGPVMVTLATSTGSAHLPTASIPFDSTNWMTPVGIQIGGVEDADTVNNSDTITLSEGVLTPVQVSVTVIDNDVQSILTNAPNTVTLHEGDTDMFYATLQYQPSGPVTIQLASDAAGTATVSPGSLTFGPADYNDTSHTYSITGTHDTNLTTDSTTIHLSEATIGSTPVAVTVADIDAQSYVVSTSNISVNEGATASFTVKLAYDPGTTQTISIADTNAMALPITPSSFTFTGGTGGTWNTPKTITVSPPLDSNAMAESATFTITGAAGAPDHAVMASVVDTTTLHTYGSATPIFTGSQLFDANLPIVIKVTVPISTTVDTLAVNVLSSTGNYTMALYADAGGVPGARLRYMPVGLPTAFGTDTGDVMDDPIAPGTYWIAVRFDQDTPVSQASTGSNVFCYPGVPYNDIFETWHDPFGAVSCTMQPPFNVWMNTYNQ